MKNKKREKHWRPPPITPDQIDAYYEALGMSFKRQILEYIMFCGSSTQAFMSMIILLNELSGDLAFVMIPEKEKKAREQ